MITLQVERPSQQPGPFVEAVAAQYVPLMPEDLKLLLNGSVSVAESKYREDPALMLARMEAFLILDDVESLAKFYKIADRTLRVLAETLLKVSLLFSPEPY